MNQRFRWTATRLGGLAAAVLLAAGCNPAAKPLGSEHASSVAADAQSPDAKSVPAAEPPRLLTDEELAQGWISLFDGQTLFGWQAASPADWKVVDGTIVVSSGEQGLLYTTSQFTDYVLRVEFQAAPETNSGIFIHTPPQPQDPARDCYEVNIAGPDNPFPTGSIVKRQKGEASAGKSDWQAYEIRVAGARVEVSLDGRPACTFEDPQPLRRGHIGLQFNVGRVAFRNLKLKPLGLTKLFNGQDLAGWKEYPDLATQASVTAGGELQLKGGPGQLESSASYGDLILQFEAQTQAVNVNSGVFFRCIPGQKLMGYESQIHHGFKNNDRWQPSDCGTGGIFRRQDARRVVGDDKKWFRQTLLADGPHVAVWVEGYQVTDWTDERKPDENPRKGLRLKPGTLMLQGHDQTTDILFRNLQAREL